jgi:hypothetical protein
MNSTAVVHVTHDLFLFTSDLNSDDTELIEIVSDEQIETRETENVDLDADNERDIILSNAHYCSELDSNLISLDLLESKGFDFRAKNGWLTVKDDDRSVLTAKRQNNVYPLRHFDARLSKDLKDQTIDKALVIKVDLDV